MSTTSTTYAEETVYATETAYPTDSTYDADAPHGTEAHTRPERAVERPRPEGAENADQMAVASFVMGLVGLLVFNLFLGPCALVLGGLALTKKTTRRGRALFGTALGVADLVVLAVTVTANGTVTWSVAG